MDVCVDHHRFVHAITPRYPGLEFRSPACQVATVAATRDFGAGCLRRPLVQGWPPLSAYVCPVLRVPAIVSVCDASEAVHGAGSAGSETPPRGAPGLTDTGLAVAGLAVAGLTATGLTATGVARSRRARGEPQTTEVVGLTRANTKPVPVATASVGVDREADRIAAGHRRNMNTAPTVGSRVVHSLLAGKTIDQLHQDPKITHAMSLIPSTVLHATVQYTQGPGSTTDPDSYPTTEERDAVRAIDAYIPFKYQEVHAR